MEAALGAADRVLGLVLSKLSDDLVKAYMSSAELGLNIDTIEREMLYTRGLLETAQGRDDVTGISGLQGLLEKLGKKADEAEDALDKLHYFKIQDKLDGTEEATPDLGDGLSAKAQHARHAAHNTAGNWLSCFSCCSSQDDVVVAAGHSANNAMDLDGGGHVGNLPFDRVAMSKKIKKLIEELGLYCAPVSNLLNIVLASNFQPHRTTSTKRFDTTSEITQKKLFGRDATFQKARTDIISATETLSVLPIVGPGGIGKTTFTQHLFNDTRIKAHFDFRIWICVSTNFDVHKLAKEILSCLLANKNEGNKIQNDTTNLNLLKESIAERLESKRFLIVLDDIWECSSNKWEQILALLQKDETSVIGNMILVTTRFPKIVGMVKTETDLIDLQGLDPNEFWEFFQLCAFGKIKDERIEQELIGIARQIANKLKCNPLAARTVGRLLSRKPQEQWVEILENKEWLNENNDNDIIPALKISYDYLPFYLKKCFSSFALFPEDYKFDKLEIIRFWNSIGIVDSGTQNKKIEVIGSDYVDELFNNGFLMKGDDNYYVMHDLLHDLSRIVSLKECAYINCSSFQANKIPQSIRYLSIFMHDTHIHNFEEEMAKLKDMIDIKNLRSLMIFGQYSSEYLFHVLRETFKELEGLRVLSIFINSCFALPYNFSKLVHLRYLKLMSPHYLEMCLPNTVSRFYHLKYLDLEQWGHGCYLPQDISRLENLRHFVAKKEFHSNVPGVGKMKFLQELKEFHVKEIDGFKLGELGTLEEIGGDLNISGLENVRTKQEAKEAKLMEKRNLVKLRLVWNKKQESAGDDILESIQPHSKIKRLCIVNHGGAVGPSWLCSNILYMENLETLHLESVAWAKLPPVGQLYQLKKLKLKNIIGISLIGPDFFGGTTEKSFTRLKEVQFHDMPELVEWVGGANCHLFSGLERIRCINCPRLTALLISSWPMSSTQDNTTWLPSLCDLRIVNCPKLHLRPLH